MALLTLEFPTLGPGKSALTQCHFHLRASVNAWCITSENNLIGENCSSSVLQQRYGKWMKSISRGRACVFLATLGGMWLRHDGVPPHFGRKVIEMLKESFKKYRLEERIRMAWPIANQNWNHFFLSMKFRGAERFTVVNQKEISVSSGHKQAVVC